MSLVLYCREWRRSICHARTRAMLHMPSGAVSSLFTSYILSATDKFLFGSGVHWRSPILLTHAPHAPAREVSLSCARIGDVISLYQH